MRRPISLNTRFTLAVLAILIAMRRRFGPNARFALVTLAILIVVAGLGWWIIR